MLAVSALLLAVGLFGLGTAPNIAAYLAAWIVIGWGMGTGLYDAAFSTVGRFMDRNLVDVITSITLFGGFASTVCWPLSAFLVDHFGWRGACIFYAGVQIAIALPIYLACLPRASAASAAAKRAQIPT